MQEHVQLRKELGGGDQQDDCIHLLRAGFLIHRRMKTRFYIQATGPYECDQVEPSANNNCKHSLSGAVYRIVCARHADLA